MAQPSNSKEVIMADDVDNFLEHYGVKGMKWGVSRSGGGSNKGRTSREDKVRAKRKDAKRRRQTLKDKDLDQLVKRLEQEKKLKNLLDEDLAPGRTATKKLLANAGTKVAGTVLAGAGVWAVKAALDGSLKSAVTPQFAVNAAGAASRGINKAAVGQVLKDLAGNVPKLKK